MHIAAELRKLLLSLHKSISKKYVMGDALMTLHRRPGTQGTCLSHAYSSAPENFLSEGLANCWETSALSVCLRWCLRGGREEGDNPFQQSLELWLPWVWWEGNTGDLKQFGNLSENIWQVWEGS